MRAIVVLSAIAVIAASVARAADATSAAPAAVPANAEITTHLALTHIPRQHGGDHVPGLAKPAGAEHFVDSYPNHAQTLT